MSVRVIAGVVLLAACHLCAPHDLLAQRAAIRIRKDATPTTARVPDGRTVYGATCANCHQATALGLPEKYPPLTGSEWVNGDERRLLRIILHGLTGDVEVEGETFSGAMPGWAPTLSDAEIAAVATYVRANFGNHTAAVTPRAVERVRHEFANRKTPWTVPELGLPPVDPWSWNREPGRVAGSGGESHHPLDRLSDKFRTCRSFPLLATDP